MKKALILLGCPESPSQTPMAIYCGNKLKTLGFDVTIAANPAASKLVEISDPEKHYIKTKIDIEECLNNLKPKSYDLLLGFVHKDAAASFFVTFYHILQTEAIALIFEKDAQLLDNYENIIKESTDAHIVLARAFHNPNPLKIMFNKTIKELYGVD
ncbi:MAG: DUF1890 domain-containing protein [Methanobrevibacter sp.]|jgi:hypothetical protein|nr:DUF1890 domain-containing protein [Candidatus Methanoflexus mossambicus]